MRPFRIVSSAFEDNDLLDRKFAAKGGPRKCDGENISPPLAWSDAPSGTRSFAILVDDAVAAHGRGVSHWVAYGLPASKTELGESEASDPPFEGNYVGGANNKGEPTYFGPCPDVGDDPHHYEFQIIATDLDPNALPTGLTKSELLNKLEGHFLGSTSMIGRYERCRA